MRLRGLVERLAVLGADEQAAVELLGVVGGQRLLGAAGGDARPPHEVLDAGRAEGAQVLAGEPCERLVGVGLLELDRHVAQLVRAQRLGADADQLRVPRHLRADALELLRGGADGLAQLGQRERLLGGFEDLLAQLLVAGFGELEVLHPLLAVGRRGRRGAVGQVGGLGRQQVDRLAHGRQPQDVEAVERLGVHRGGAGVQRERRRRVRAVDGRSMSFSARAALGAARPSRWRS